MLNRFLDTLKGFMVLYLTLEHLKYYLNISNDAETMLPFESFILIHLQIILFPLTQPLNQ